MPVFIHKQSSVFIHKMQSSSTNMAARRFSCCAPIVWNSLPSFVHTADSFTSFRSQLKTHMFARHFQPVLCPCVIKNLLLTYLHVFVCVVRECRRVQRRSAYSPCTTVTVGSLCCNACTWGQLWHAGWYAVQSKNSRSLYSSTHRL